MGILQALIELPSAINKLSKAVEGLQKAYNRMVDERFDQDASKARQKEVKSSEDAKELSKDINDLMSRS